MIEFFTKLFRTQSMDKIILTLNRIMTGAITRDIWHLKVLTRKLFKRIAILFPLEYGKIRGIHPGRKFITSFNNERSRILTSEG